MSFTAGFDYEAFVADPRTVYAVTRCLEIISEASRRLPDDLKARHPSIAWQDLERVEKSRSILGFYNTAFENMYKHKDGNRKQLIATARRSCCN